MTTAAVSRYVTRNPDILGGEPIIMGTRVSVRALVGQWRLGTPAEEIPTQFPQLTLAQVFDALSFYLDNQVEINEYIERNRIPEELIHPAVRKALEAE
ncbi:DUF433 domain-containing protein [Leptolyngbyaceae cyanobacterium CCMR0082]|uniref:DUF433 domain-containing protein n=2 Tax=Adonisia turfae TaxID=2950184 RepID=A0A6M0SHQ1_9CYAN|nr:DUF433 domain-containing protein [Adonisia turfae]NEZ60821.1 DUF433 domain-containing protein [Adonisia turfae CCMR0081]NEZ67533.1 DUF433 domain-containing protein [Adonisia turfae CCMR0082]